MVSTSKGPCDQPTCRAVRFAPDKKCNYFVKKISTCGSFFLFQILLSVLTKLANSLYPQNIGPAGHQTYRALVIINPATAPTAPPPILPNSFH